jgi:hypothetical protein
VTYDQEKQEYKNFCAKKLCLATGIDEPTSKEKDETKEVERKKAKEEEFLAFASKRHPEHPVYADYILNQKVKKQKINKKQGFNSPNPKNKENTKN